MTTETQGKTELATISQNSAFKELSKHLSQKSLFHILGVQSRETSHSKFLGWLLDPTENHGLATEPLISFLQLAGCTERIYTDNAKVIAEYTIDNNKRPDIIVFSDPSIGSKPILLIEYKVKAFEHNNQTTNYAKWVRQASGTDENTCCCVFLAPRETQAEDIHSAFKFVSYSDYYKWLQNIHKQVIDNRTKIIIEEFMTCLSVEGWIQDSKTEQLTNILQRKFSTEIERLQHDDLRNFVSQQNGPTKKILQLLGIETIRTFSLGPDELAIKVTKELKNSLGENHWYSRNLNGSGKVGSVIFRSTDFKKKVDNILNKEGINDSTTVECGLTFFMPRPDEKGKTTFHLTADLNLNNTNYPKLKIESKNLRRAIRESFQNYLKKNAPEEKLPYKFYSTPPTRVIDIKINTLDNSAEEVDGTIDNIKKYSKEIDGHIEEWVNSEFSTILKNYIELSIN